MIQASINSKLNSSQKALGKVDTNHKLNAKLASLKVADTNLTQCAAIKSLIEKAYKSTSNPISVTKFNNQASSMIVKNAHPQPFNRNLKLEKALVPVVVAVNVNSTRSDKPPESIQSEKPLSESKKGSGSAGNFDKLLLSNKGAESKSIHSVQSQTNRKKSITSLSSSVDFSQLKNQVPTNRPSMSKIGSPKPEISIKVASPNINYNDISKEFSESGTYFPKHKQELQTIETSLNSNIIEEIEIKGNFGSSPKHHLTFNSMRENTVRPNILKGPVPSSIKVNDSPKYFKQADLIFSAQPAVIEQQSSSLQNLAEIDRLIEKILSLQSSAQDFSLRSPNAQRKIFNIEHIAELYLFYYSRNTTMSIKELLNLISIDPYSFVSEDQKRRITLDIKNDSEKRTVKYKECLQYINYAMSEVSNMIKGDEIENQCNDHQYEDTSHLVLCSETISSPKADNIDDESLPFERSKKPKRSWYDCCLNNVLGELEIVREEIDESKFTSKGASRTDSIESENKKFENQSPDTAFLLDLELEHSTLRYNNVDSLNTDTIVHLPSISENMEYCSTKQNKLQVSINSISSTLDTPQSNCNGINFKSKPAQESLNLRSLEIMGYNQ